MSQQTTINGLLPYYSRFLSQFPNVQALSEAKERDVLRAWEGLGYYSRARNLQKAAQIIVRDFDAKMPSERDLLESLPGIGSYTAGAILAIAFGKRELAIDGNFLRVYTRFFGLSEPIDNPRVVKDIWLKAQAVLPKKSGQAMRAFTEGVMDLGALICTPKNPKCLLCPLKASCLARKKGLTSVIPFKSKKILRKKLCELGYFYEASGKLAVLKKGIDPKYPYFHRLPYRSMKQHSKDSKAKKFKYSVTVRDFDYRIRRSKPPKSLLEKCVWKTSSSVEKMIFPAVDRKVIRHFWS